MGSFHTPWPDHDRLLPTCSMTPDVSNPHLPHNGFVVPGTVNGGLREGKPVPCDNAETGTGLRIIVESYLLALHPHNAEKQGLSVH